MLLNFGPYLVALLVLGVSAAFLCDRWIFDKRVGQVMHWRGPGMMSRWALPQIAAIRLERYYSQGACTGILLDGGRLVFASGAAEDMANLGRRIAAFLGVEHELRVVLK
jgi:hypothetical protein